MNETKLMTAMRNALIAISTIITSEYAANQKAGTPKDRLPGTALMLPKHDDVPEQAVFDYVDGRLMAGDQCVTGLWDIAKQKPATAAQIKKGVAQLAPHRVTSLLRKVSRALDEQPEVVEVKQAA